MVDEAAQQLTDSLGAAANAGLALTIIVSLTLVSLVFMAVIALWIRSRTPILQSTVEGDKLLAEAIVALSKNTARSAIANEKVADNTEAISIAQASYREMLVEDRITRLEATKSILTPITVIHGDVQIILAELRILKTECNEQVRDQIGVVIKQLDRLLLASSGVQNGGNPSTEIVTTTKTTVEEKAGDSNDENKPDSQRSD